MNAASDFSTGEYSYKAWFAETADTGTYFIPPACPNARFISALLCKVCRTCELSPLHITSQANYNIEIWFRQRRRDGPCVAAGMIRQIGICDDVSIWNQIPVPISLRVGWYLMSVTELWDMKICLCMCKRLNGNTNVLDFKSHWLMNNECDIIMHITVKRDNSHYIRYETH